MSPMPAMARFGILGTHQAEYKCRHDGGNSELHTSSHFGTP
jgi:hypothetical protein